MKPGGLSGWTKKETINRIIAVQKKKIQSLRGKWSNVFSLGTIAMGQKTPQWRTGRNSKCSTESWGFSAKEQGGLSGWKIIPRKHGVGSILAKQA